MARLAVSRGGVIQRIGRAVRIRQQLGMGDGIIGAGQRLVGVTEQPQNA